MQVDFVGHAQNPHFKRGLPRGEAARLAAPLISLRMEPKSEGFQCAALHLSASRSTQLLRGIAQPELCCRPDFCGHGIGFCTGVVQQRVQATVGIRSHLSILSHITLYL